MLPAPSAHPQSVPAKHACSGGWRPCGAGAKEKSGGKPHDKPNMVCGPVQVCWLKFARYWDIEIREMPMSENHYVMSPEDMLSMVDENTIFVVPTFGQTFTGFYEPVKPLSDALDKLQSDTGLDIDIHVDAASGGFLAPFCAKDILWDFRLPRVKSISASGHKFGLAPLGVGWVVWREVKDLPEGLIFHVNYLGGDLPTFALNFSRPAGQIICQYYNLLRLGREGYRRIHAACYNTAQMLADELQQLGPFEMYPQRTGTGRYSGRDLAYSQGCEYPLYPLRSCRPSENPRLASPGLPPATRCRQHHRPAHSGQTGIVRRYGLHAA